MPVLVFTRFRDGGAQLIDGPADLPVALPFVHRTAREHAGTGREFQRVGPPQQERLLAGGLAPQDRSRGVAGNRGRPARRGRHRQ